MKKSTLTSSHKHIPGKRHTEKLDYFRHAFDHASLGMALVSLDGKWLRVNKALTELTGHSEKELLKNTIQNKQLFNSTSLDELINGHCNSYKQELQYMHKSGYPVWILVNISLVRNQRGKPLYFVYQIQNINQQKETHDQLMYQASHDTLTGLIHRAELMTRIEENLARAAAFPDLLLAVFFMDLDHFKKINDTLGHLIGDQVLIEVAWRLSGVLRKEDVVARFGGDEFAIMVAGLKSKSDAALISDKILKVINKPYHIHEQTLHLTASIGIACYPEGGRNPEELLKNADFALLKAKEKGKGIFEFYTG